MRKWRMKREKNVELEKKTYKKKKGRRRERMYKRKGNLIMKKS